MSQCSLCGGEILDRSDSRYCVYCNSTFHRSCIIEHFYRNKYCPVCNKKMSLLFMRYGEPPQPKVKKRSLPTEIRKPTWPETERRTEVPVFDIDIPSGPLKKTDNYIPKPKEKRELSLPAVKIPKKLIAIIVILVVGGIGAYYGRGYIPQMPQKSNDGKSPSGSPWNVVWSYPLEGVTEIALSPQGIAVGGRTGLVVFNHDGTILWQREGEISDVDMKNDVIAVCNRGVCEIYNIDGDELARYKEGTCTTVSLTEVGVLAVGVSEGGVVLLDITGDIMQQYETQSVSSVSISPQGEFTAYREGQTVKVIDIMGDPLYGFEDGGSAEDSIIVTSSGHVFAQAQNEVFLFSKENEDVVWSVPASCKAGLAVSDDETLFGINADQAVLYNAQGEKMFSLPKGGCGGIAVEKANVVVSDSSNVYYLKKPEEQVEPAESESESQSETEAPPETQQPATELEDYSQWFTFFQSFLSTADSAATYTLTSKKGDDTDKMTVTFSIEGKEQNNIIEKVTMSLRSGEQEITTSFRRWIDAQGDCTKAELTRDGKASSIECNKTSIRGINFRDILQYQSQFEYMGQEEITVGRGTFSCHKLQVTTSSGVMTIWITDNLPPVRIVLQEGDTTITMELE